MLSETCNRCGQEVRYGKRGGITGWLHRENVDHMPLFGQPVTPEMAAEIDRELHRVRTRTTESGETVEYTAHGFGLKGEAKKAYERALRGGEDEDTTLPEPELRATPVEPDDFPPRSGIRQIANLVTKQGWERVRFTKSRGPYIGADGSVLSISDSVVLGAAGPRQLDGTRRVAVASWRDGKFDSAYIGTFKNGQITTTSANSTGLKDWIKGSDDQPDAVLEA